MRRLERETYRQASHATWEAMAPGWKRWRAQLEEDAAPVREWMVHALAAEPGNTVLELSAGAGDTGFEVAAILGNDGRGPGLQRRRELSRSGAERTCRVSEQSPERGGCRGSAIHSSKGADYPARRSVCDEFDAERRPMGVVGDAVFQSVDDPNDLTVWHDFETVETARSFAASDALRDAMVVRHA